MHDVQQQNEEREQEDPEGVRLGMEDMNLDEDPEDEEKLELGSTTTKKPESLLRMKASWLDSPR